MAAKKSENLSFDAALNELASVVKSLEQGDLPLEESLKQFERGIQLARVSKQKLEQAEQQVQILMKENGEEKLQPFDVDSKNSRLSEE